ncbi:hypothetical protein ACFVVM_06035 [Nocardia sp. NPDC058176]|uniref:hypothetical protein n=1 Tax=Nocardia sp. NPDC058176 TaxID=3346368 RepID=UPI0036DB0FC5
MSERVERADEHDRVLGVVDRDEAIGARWLHRVATVVCWDVEGRILVHRRPDDSARFPAHHNWRSTDTPRRGGEVLAVAGGLDGLVE